MKIAIPTLDNNGENSQLGGHFGRAPFFTVYNKEDNTYEAVANSGEHFGGAQSTPAIVQASGAEVMICMGLGRKAVDLFNQLKISVYITDKTIVKDVLADFNENKLQLVTEDTACAGHGH